jgi:threonine/homoserine/homoserine lactone efflux protein
VALKVAGALYVLWLAWKMLRAGTMDATDEAKPATFIDGVALLVLNPKAYVIIALMFTQFLGQGSMGMFASIMLITTVFTLNNFIAFSVWALAGDQIAGYFRSPKSARLLNLMFGGVLAAVALWILFS